jgi:hypothetical protein
MRGGEQPEANVPSVTIVNSIRPLTLASLLGKRRSPSDAIDLDRGVTDRTGCLPVHAVMPERYNPNTAFGKVWGGWRRKVRKFHNDKQGDLLWDSRAYWPSCLPSPPEQESERP